MTFHIGRREFLIGAGLGLMSAAPGGPEAEIAAIESQIGGRVGVAALDILSGWRINYRSGERFAMASTFKLLLAAQILTTADKGEIRLDKMIPYTEKDLLPHSPVTTAHVKEGALPVEALAEAAIEQSDNTAANLLLAQIGGPAGLTAFARSIGDGVTRLDRTETDLNTNLPGDPRDTTSPSAMLGNLQRTGDLLSVESSAKLMTWMIYCETGLNRLRAGFPEGWTVGDKTGAGANGAFNDLAVAWPPGRRQLPPPIVVACYMNRVTANDGDVNAAYARIAGIIAKAFI